MAATVGVPVDVTKLPAGQLLTDYRDLLLKLGADRTNRQLAGLADRYEQEINRRVAW